MPLSVCILHESCVVIRDPYTIGTCPLCQSAVELSKLEKILNEIEEKEPSNNAKKNSALEK